MRANLAVKIGVNTPANANDRLRPAAVVFPLAIAVMAFASGALLANQPAAAETASALLRSLNAQSTSLVCHKVDEVNEALFPSEHVVGYDFSGTDAAKLKKQMDGVVEVAAPDASLIRLVLVPAANEAIAFQFGKDGCHTLTLDLDVREMGKLFESAGVGAPFGATYYQITGRSI
jgi:hypothetical protein